jgi:hypothetical protein
VPRVSPSSSDSTAARSPRPPPWCLCSRGGPAPVLLDRLPTHAVLGGELRRGCAAGSTLGSWPPSSTSVSAPPHRYAAEWERAGPTGQRLSDFQRKEIIDGCRRGARRRYVRQYCREVGRSSSLMSSCDGVGFRSARRLIGLEPDPVVRTLILRRLLPFSGKESSCLLHIHRSFASVRSSW